MIRAGDAGCENYFRSRKPGACISRRLRTQCAQDIVEKRGSRMEFVGAAHGVILNDSHLREGLCPSSPGPCTSA